MPLDEQADGVPPLLYSDKFHYSAYWDTLADMASSLVGGIAGAAVGAYGFELYRRRRGIGSSRGPAFWECP